MSEGTKRSRKTPWLSLALLMVTYASFGWFLSSPAFPAYNLPLAVVWVCVISIAFMRPLVSFTQFITRWFKSDTVAFLSIFMMAGVASLLLFWLHIFLYILTILAAESLARIDMQTQGVAEIRVFWILATVSLLGLGVGYGLRMIL